MATVENVIISIDGQSWNFWESVELTLALDNFSTISFTSPFEPDEQLFRDTFVPFTYKNLTLEVAAEDDPGIRDLLFAGQLVETAPRLTPLRKTVECSGYSLAAQLADVTPPLSAFPLEFNGMTLQQIAQQLAEPFFVTVEFDEDSGTAFKKVKIKAGDKVYDFLAKLAQLRNFVITDTPEGNLRFFRSISSGVPIARFQEGVQPLISVAATFNPQTYFSEITGFVKTKAALKGSRYTVTNPKLPNATRSLSYVADDVKSPDLPTAVTSKMARMFGDMVSYVIEVPTWRDPQGDLWQPNTLVALEAPGAMIYNETTFLVRDVILSQDASQTIARLGLVLPGSFSGEIPAVFPWD